MKYMKKNDRKPLLRIVILAVAAIVLVAALVFILTRKGTAPTPEDAANIAASGEAQNDGSGETAPSGDGEDNDSVTESAPDSDKQPSNEEKVPVAIETPYCTLHYPGEWKDFLGVTTSEDQGYEVTFSAELESGKTQELFSILFSDSAENAYGMLNTADGSSVAVSVESVDFKPDDSWTDREINIVFTMQEALNDLLSEMDLEILEQAPQDGDTVLPPDNSEDMAIDTPYGELYYPSRWLDYLTVKIEEENDYRVAFYSSLEGHDDQHLFTVYFGGDQGAVAAMAADINGKAVEVRVSLAEFAPDDSWTEDEKSIVYAMQEDLNHLLSKLN